MTTIIDENNLVTDDGVELVAEVMDWDFLTCTDCYFQYCEGCDDAPCSPNRRTDGRDVLFVEKKPC